MIEAVTVSSILTVPQVYISFGKETLTKFNMEVLLLQF